MFRLVLLLHFLGAIVWTGGHSMLAVGIPRLDPQNLHSLAWHIFSVTVISVVFVIVNVAFRTGWSMQ